MGDRGWFNSQFSVPRSNSYPRLCAVVFERYGRAAARDRDYVNACYERVCNQMQLELDDTVVSLKHKTFEVVCQARFDLSRRKSDYLIAAVEN